MFFSFVSGMFSNLGTMPLIFDLPIFIVLDKLLFFDNYRIMYKSQKYLQMYAHCICTYFCDLGPFLYKSIHVTFVF